MSLTSFEEFLSSNAIDEVECLVPDITGSARGKILPASKFEKGSKNRGLRIPEDIFILTVTGAYSWKSDATDDASIDVYMKPDPRDGPARAVVREPDGGSHLRLLLSR